jgi:hypothetical protein
MKNIILISLLSIFSFHLYAQDKHEKRENIKALKTAFITTELNLSSEEAQKFWPVYNVYSDRKHELMQERKKLLSSDSFQKMDNIDEKEAEKLIVQLEKIDAEFFEIKKKMVVNLKPIIGAKKLLKLKKTEEDFNRKLLKQYRGNKKEE